MATMQENFPNMSETMLAFNVASLEAEDARELSPKRGWIYMRLEDENGNVVEERQFENVVTNDARLLSARLWKNNAEPTKGVYYLAVGTGAGASPIVPDPQNPSVAQSDQRALAAEVARKMFSSINFVNPVSGLVSAIPTRLLDMTATFEASEANAALQEMGVVAAPIVAGAPHTPTPCPEVKGSTPTIDMSLYDTLANYKTYKVFNKPVGSKMTVTWRFQF